jgi:zona occludens toxin (predicted ATPase)
MIEAFTGLPGAGKTYHMTKKAFFEAKRGRPVYANYQLNFGDIKTHYFKELDELQGIKNALILVDEAGIYLPAQAWRNIPFEFIRQIRQHRHDGLDLWYTAQDMQDVATYLRRITQFQHDYNKIWKFSGERTINPRNKAKYGFDFSFLNKKFFKLYDTTENIDFGNYLKDAMKSNMI